MPSESLPDLSPTLEQFIGYQLTCDYFNRELFQTHLTQCHLNFSCRAASGVYFRPLYWRKGNDKPIHEIGLNPTVLAKPLPEIVVLLVRGMGYQWQYDFGTPSPSKGYCNRELVEKLKSIGLLLTDTGEIGGRETGKWLRHVIIPGGPLEQAVDHLPEHCKLSWTSDAVRIIKPPSTDKIKYTCPECLAQVWGKTELAFGCMCEKQTGAKWEADVEEEAV